jgi:hypothetical protein
MCRRIMSCLLALVLSACVSWQSAAQDNPVEASPLSVTAESSNGVGSDCKGGEGLLVHLQYSGTQPLRGYLVRLAIGGSVTGKTFAEQTVEGIRDSREPMIAPGAEWTRTVCSITKSKTGEDLSVSAQVDVLKFADGSIWGPAELSESHELIGTLDGMDFMGKTTELERFVSPILPQRGPFPVEAVKSQTIGPLKIESGVWRDEHGQEMLAAAVTNESTQPIRGYLYTTSFFDPATGKLIRQASTKELETHGKPSDYLAPGSTWIADPRKFSRLPDGILADYKIRVDLVVFADGSIFGPKKSAESDEVLGILQGIDAVNLSSGETSASKDR